MLSKLSWIRSFFHFQTHLEETRAKSDHPAPFVTVTPRLHHPNLLTVSEKQFEQPDWWGYAPFMTSQAAGKYYWVLALPDNNETVSEGGTSA